MKKFIGFVKKEFIHIFRDVRTLVVLFGLPVAQILIFGFVIRNEIQDVQISILDKSKDPVTFDITNRILSSGFFRLHSYLKTESEADEVFKAGKVREIVVFGKNFAENIQKENKASLQLLADASDPNSARMIVSYTQAIVSSYLKEAKGKDQQPVT